MESPVPCPNCHSPVAPGTAVCPNCGAPLPTDAPVWPPPPAVNILPPQPPAPRLLTGHPAGDFTLGLVITLASMLFYCMGLLVMPVIYFTQRATAPVFARGIGYGLLIGGVVLLGGLALCLYGNHY